MRIGFEYRNLNSQAFPEAEVPEAADRIAPRDGQVSGHCQLLFDAECSNNGEAPTPPGRTFGSTPGNPGESVRLSRRREAGKSLAMRLAERRKADSESNFIIYISHIAWNSCRARSL
jgi:hypothetical protein